MDKQQRKELITEYKQQKTSGGIYRIYNKETGKSFIKGDANLDAVKNRFQFSQTVNSAYTLVMAKDWAQYGSGSFAMEILEQIEIGGEESPKAFLNRLKKREAQWKEKCPSELLY